jgi:signal transduction histidine kinase
VVTVDELGIRLRDFFRPLHQNGTRITVTTGENSDQILTEIQTTHLFRIIQEAINNAYKYSGCSQIDVKLRIEEGRKLCFVVEDNGKGFDVNSIERGNGLRNMESRMRELQGELKIKSFPGKGTMVEGCFEVQNTNIFV